MSESAKGNADQPEQYDVLVVGSGEAGKYLAWSMATGGRRTALVERKLIGGSCPNIACLPSKNVIYSAKVASYLTQRSAEFGLPADHVRVDMTRVFKRKQAMVDGLISLHRERFRTSGVDLVIGEATFLEDRTVHAVLRDGGSRLLRGDKLFLSLGTRSALPPIPGLVEAKPMTHIEALDLQRLPEHLVVLGAGYIALELAQAFRRFGSSVTVIERGPQMASKEDDEVGAALLQLFHDEGIEVLLDTSVTEVRGLSGTGVELEITRPCGSCLLKGTDLLIATGRVPNTQGIGLDRLGVQLDSLGFIQVNEHLETTAADIWAMGDCAGTPQFTHAAYDDFRVVRDSLLGSDSPRTTRNRLIPSCMFTDPELVRVGLNEREARRIGIPYRTARLPASAILRTHTLSEGRGFLKMLIAKDSDKILGFTGFCVEASELLAAVHTAMAAGASYTVLRDAIYTHPTMSEGLVFLLSAIPS